MLLNRDVVAGSLWSRGPPREREFPKSGIRLSGHRMGRRQARGPRWLEHPIDATLSLRGRQGIIPPSPLKRREKSANRLVIASCVDSAIMVAVPTEEMGGQPRCDRGARQRWWKGDDNARWPSSRGRLVELGGTAARLRAEFGDAAAQRRAAPRGARVLGGQIARQAREAGCTGTPAAGPAAAPGPAGPGVPDRPLDEGHAPQSGLSQGPDAAPSYRYSPSGWPPSHPQACCPRGPTPSQVGCGPDQPRYASA